MGHGDAVGFDMQENAAAVVRAIYRTARCLECIAAQTEQRIVDVSKILEMIGRTMYVAAPPQPCEECGASAPVFRIGH